MTHSAGALSTSGEAGPRVGPIKRRLNLRISCCPWRNRFRRHEFLRFGGAAGNDAPRAKLMVPGNQPLESRMKPSRASHAIS